MAAPTVEGPAAVEDPANCTERWDGSSPGSCELAVKQHLRVIVHASQQHDVWYDNAFHAVRLWLRHVSICGVILHTTLLRLQWSGLFERIR